MWPRSRSMRTGWPFDLDLEIATEHEVGQDRVGGDAELLGGEAGPGRRLRAALLEGDPSRAQERQDRERDDDDRGRETDQDGCGTAAEVVHPVILARLRVHLGRGARAASSAGRRNVPRSECKTGSRASSDTIRRLGGDETWQERPLRRVRHGSRTATGTRFRRLAGDGAVQWPRPTRPRASSPGPTSPRA